MTRGREVSFTTPHKEPFKTVFQFKITLIGLEPPIWRRIQVPCYYTFYDLHVAIQNAMGWTDSHLHAFEIEKKRPVRIESPYAVDELFEEAEGFTPNISLARFFVKEKDAAIYEYDFGDGWRHEVLLEDIVLRKAGVKYPVCLDGQRACPPEDCGGPSGYDHLLSAVNNPRTQDDLELREWLGLKKGEILDPSAWDYKEVTFNNPRKLLKEYLKG